MGKLYKDSDELLTSIKVRAAVPLAQASFSDDDLLNFATEEIELKVVPSVLSVREEFYVTTATIPLEANKSNYKIPYRSIGGRVRFVYMRQSNTDATAYPLAQIPLENLPIYQDNTFAYQYSGFYLQNDELVILPPIKGGVSGQLIIHYYMKPNKVVPMSRGAKIIAIDTTTGEIQVDEVPANIAANEEVDFIQAKSNHKTKGFDVLVTAVNVNAGLISVNPNDIPTGLEVGDFICSAGETVIPQVPSELQVMVAQAVACRVLEAIGDTQGLANANAKLQEMETKLLPIIDARVEAPGRKVVNTNSFIRNRRYIKAGRF
jgi:hypothetical protein